MALETAKARRLFDAIRAIKGSALTQADVDAVNHALANDMLEAAATDSRRTGKAGLDLIRSFESYRPITYADPGTGGRPYTGGWGSTLDENGKPFALGVTHDQPYWTRLFLRDVAAKETAVNVLLGDAPTTQNQFDALVSFAYNVGEDIDDDDKAEGLGDSSLLKAHLRGDYARAQAKFADWCFAGGKVLNGLVRRRAAEAALYGAP